jgi:branched-chain amino acid aminotransferase
MQDFTLPTFSHHQKYYSFYSSYFNLTTVDPRLMLVPIDDHGFHRGDGVFEAVKWNGKNIWLLDKHLERLFKSADKIALKICLSKNEIQHKIIELVDLSGKASGMIRIYVTRGPGNFGVSPKETIGSQIYIVTTELKEVSSEILNKGVRLGFSDIKPKEGIFAQTKSLNYLPNVLMKMECEARGLDFVVGVNAADNFITESYTENIFCAIGKNLYYPNFDYILKGTSLLRFIELIELKLKKTALPYNSISSRNITKQELLESDAIFIIGTTIDILWVNHLDMKGFLKPVSYELLRNLLVSDQLTSA